MNTGWICPRCSKVHAPDVKGCSCPPMFGQWQYPRSPFDGLPKEPAPTVMYPMPLCGCTGPCANAACPHRPGSICILPDGQVNTYAGGVTVVDRP